MKFYVKIEMEIIQKTKNGSVWNIKDIANSFTLEALISGPEHSFKILVKFVKSVLFMKAYHYFDNVNTIAIAFFGSLPCSPLALITLRPPCQYHHARCAQVYCDVW